MKKIKKYLNEKTNKIKNKILNFKNKKNNFYDGIFKNTDFILPSYINLNNPNFIEIDKMFYSGIIIVNYYREQTELLLKNLIENNSNINISIFYEKQNTYKTINDLTYHIGNVGADIKAGNENRQDIEVAAYTYNDAKYIRKEMQLNNEEMYFLYIYLNVFSKDEKELKYILEKIEGLAQSRGMQTRRANFRQEQIFLSSLPIAENQSALKDASRRNILTSGLISTYPFISSSICDENGIFIGTNIYNNSLVFVDRYNTEKYKNANMCIFGTSGAGKSFYTKLLILRGKLLGIEQ